MKFEPLFKNDDDWHNNACLNYMHDHSPAYITGYRMAAESLVIQINDGGPGQDLLVYPIVFLYRQYLELLLKSLIKQIRILNQNKATYPIHHKLNNLWSDFTADMKKWTVDIPEEDFKYVKHIINELTTADPLSMSFRYSEDKDGKKHIPDIKYINLRHFAQMVSKAGDVLEGVDCWLSTEIDNITNYSY